MMVILLCNVSAIYELLSMKKVHPVETSNKHKTENAKFIMMMSAISVVYIVFSTPLLVSTANTNYPGPRLNELTNNQKIKKKRGIHNLAYFLNENENLSMYVLNFEFIVLVNFRIQNIAVLIHFKFIFYIV